MPQPESITKANISKHARSVMASRSEEPRPRVVLGLPSPVLAQNQALRMERFMTMGAKERLSFEGA